MIKKFFISIIIFIMLAGIICSSFFRSNAGGLDFARSEAAGNYEPVITPPTPGDDSGGGYTGGSDPTPTPEPEPSLSISVPTSVEGIVFEDLKKYELVNDGSMAGTKHEMYNLEKDSDENAVEGVQILNDDSMILETDENGKYSFGGNGTYNLSFKYGTKLDKDNYKLNRDTLKYNGQDYTVVATKDGMTMGCDPGYLSKINELKDSFTEVYIVIDYSQTMRDDSKGTSRLEIVKESALKFVQALYEEADGNLAVGFIAFGYEAAIVKRPTEVEADVIDGITNFKVESGVGKYSGQSAPNFSSLNHKVGTNIGGAVLKANSSYLSSESNKIMVLFSDGCATAHENVESLYADDSDEEIKSKLEDVAKYTKQNLLTVNSSNTKLISVLNKTEELEKEYRNKAFTDDSGNWIGSHYDVDYFNIDDVKNMLLNNVKEEIEDSNSELTAYTPEREIANSTDEENRRKEVNNYYRDIYYGKLKLFNLIKDLKGNNLDLNTVASYVSPQTRLDLNQKLEIYKKFIDDENDAKKSEVEEFIENSWMKTKPIEVKLYEICNEGGRVSSIRCGGEEVYSFEYYEKDGEEYCKVNGAEYKANRVTVTPTTVKLNAALIKRDDFKLELEKKITGFRLTLSDGTVLYNKVSKNANQTLERNKLYKEAYSKQLQNKSNEVKIKNDWKLEEVIEYIPETVTMIVDTDLLQGATIEIEYTLIVKNNSENNTFSDAISIVDYFDNGVIYRPNSKLLSEKGTNADYGWKVLTTEYLYDEDKTTGKQFVSKDVYENGDLICLYANYNKKGYEEAEDIPSDGNITDYTTKSKYMNPVIGNNGERYVKVVLSRVLSAEILDDFAYKNQAEIIQYSNNDSRRINFSDGNGDKLSYKYPTSGNFIPTAAYEHLISGIDRNEKEIDTAIANPVQLIPPTGLRKYNMFGMTEYKNYLKTIFTSCRNLFEIRK